MKHIYLCKKFNIEEPVTEYEFIYSNNINKVKQVFEIVWKLIIRENSYLTKWKIIKTQKFKEENRIFIYSNIAIIKRLLNQLQ